MRSIPERRKDTGRDRKEAEKAQEELPLKLDAELKEKLTSAANAIAAITRLAEDDTDKQREAFDEASQELHAAFAPLADLHTAYLMDGGLRPGDYAHLVNHFATGGGEDDLPSDLNDAWQRVRRLRDRHHFFHWPLEFPEVFTNGSSSGFSATVGNPPWDMSSANPEDFFHVYDPEFRTLDRNEVLKRTEELCSSNPALRLAWQSYQATITEQNELFAEPAAYADAPTGKNNLFQYFLLRFLALTATSGRMSILIPSSIYTDKGCAPLRRLILDKNRLECLYCLSNERYIFPHVHHAFRFALVVVEKNGRTEHFNAFFAIDVRQAIAPDVLYALLSNLEQKPMRLAMETLCREIMALTKLNWNSCAFASAEPITIQFARTIGRILTEVPDGSIIQCKYRFYM